MTTATPPPASAIEHELVEHTPMPASLDGPSREILDLALVAIDGMPQLEPADRVHEEEEVKTLLAGIEADEQRREDLQGWLRAAAGTGQARYSVLARLMGVPEVTEPAEQLSSTEIVRRFETQGFVKQAPDFADQLNDGSRAGVKLQYDGQRFSDPVEQRGQYLYPTTELEALRELNGFLGGFMAKSTKFRNRIGVGTARGAAKSMQKNLTYIGNKELVEGSSGLGQSWSEFLEQDEANQLCVITTSSLTGEQSRQGGIGLSDDFIRGQVLESMARRGVSADVMGRIITDPRKISGDPAKVKIVFVDDWVVSGRQMRNKIRNSLALIGEQYQSSIEIDVLAAPQHFVADGFKVDDVSYPVKAYYRAHRANAEDSEDVRCHITGSHSTVNFGFSVQLEYMQRILNEIRGAGQRMVRMPAIASIYRRYWPAKARRLATVG